MSRVNSSESSATLPPSHVYTCSICHRVFDSIYALGGHQNAHRKGKIEELDSFIRHRLNLDAVTPDTGVLSASASSESAAETNNDNNNNKKAMFDVGEPSRKCTKGKGKGKGKGKAKAEAEAEALSLELTLAVQGSARKRAGHVNYNYPDVLFPASEFLDTTVDLDLKL